MAHPFGNAGLLMSLTVPEPRHEEEYNAWFDDEHMPERLSIPGFLSARRWVSTTTPGRYLATYELESLAVLSSPAYLAHFGDNQTPWSKRNLARLVEFKRWTAAQAGPNGVQPAENASGLLLSSFDIVPGREAEVLSWFDEEHLPLLRRNPATLAARRFSASSGTPRNIALYEVSDPAAPTRPEWMAAGQTPRSLAVAPGVVPGRIREIWRAYPKSWPRTWKR